MLKTKFALIGATLLMTTASYAHDDSCNINLEGDIEYRQGVLNVGLENGKTMTITPQRIMLIDGEEISLSAQQQAWVDEYYSNIQRAIPMSLKLAGNGIELAQTAINEVFGELLGPGNDVATSFDEMFKEMSNELNTRFYDSNGEVYVNTKDLENNQWITEDWESRVEEQVEKAITQSMGSILMAIGSQMMADGGDMEAFGERMENFGESIEQRIEAQAMALEFEADQVCQVLAAADKAENQLQQSVAQLSSLNLMQVEHNKM